MAKLYKLCMQTFEAARHEDGSEYVKEVTRCGKWHTSPEECIQDNMTYIISHPRQKFTLINEDFLEPTLEEPKDLSSLNVLINSTYEQFSQQNVFINMHQITDDEITLFNMWRQNKKSQSFKSSEAIEALHSLNLPQTPGFLTALVKHNILIKSGAGKSTSYSVCPTPVHKSQLQDAWTYYVKPKTKFQMDIRMIVEKNPEEVIQILKSLGYRIQKQEWITL